jgi:hypothetical protein
MSAKSIWITAAIGCVGVMLLKANLIRIPADQPTIQAGINAAFHGDTVVVYPGTYYENIIFRGKKIVLTSRFYETGNLDFIQSTIIDGSQAVHPDTASCVLIINHEDSTTVLQGFTLTGGKGTAWLDEHGAGRYREGGGVLTALSSPTIRYNLIINNEATNMTGLSGAGGGGIRAGDGNPSFYNNIITMNKGGYGAGIVLNYTAATLKNNIISNNSGRQDFGGGALWMNHDGSAAKIIENNTIVNNKTGGIYVWQGSSIVRNCIIWGNSSYQISVRNGGPAVSYCDVQEGWAGTGNIETDPEFADTLFHLSNSSSCIDAGDSTAVYNDLENLSSPGNAQWPSNGGLRNDMGAYGGPAAGVLPDFHSTTGIGSSGHHVPNEIRLEQNYPNPFNAQTTISYSIPQKQFVSMKIIDLLGREIESLIHENQEAGWHYIRYNGDHLSTGIYFLLLQTDGLTDVKKISFIK